MEISSRNVVDGTARSPHRAMYRAMGLEDEDISKSFVGVCHTGNEATPCNIHLPGLAEHAKKGVSEGGATPRIFSTIAVSDGIAMGHEGMKSSLVSREVIADSIELMVRAHQYDALVGIAGCDKSLPGTMMAMARLNIPSVFVYGGTIMPGMLDGKELTIVDVYEAVGAYDSGKISIDDLKDIEKICMSNPGSYGGIFLQINHPLLEVMPTWQSKANCLRYGCHCICSKHSTTRASNWTCSFFNIFEIINAYLS